MTALGAASADSAPSRRRAGGGGGGGGEAHYPGSQHHLHILNPGLACHLSLAASVRCAQVLTLTQERLLLLAGDGRHDTPEHPTSFRRRLHFGGTLFSRPGLGPGHVTTPAAAPRPWLQTRSWWPGPRAREAGTLAKLWANR